MTNGEIIAGLEPPESSIAAIDWITSVGAIPTVCVFRPLIGTDLEDAEPPKTEEMVPVFRRLYEACMETGPADRVRAERPRLAGHAARGVSLAVAEPLSLAERQARHDEARLRPPLRQARPPHGPDRRLGLSPRAPRRLRGRSDRARRAATSESPGASSRESPLKGRPDPRRGAARSPPRAGSGPLSGAFSVVGQPRAPIGPRGTEGFGLARRSLAERLRSPA